MECKRHEDLCTIPIELYKQLTKCDIHFSNTHDFDVVCGLRYHSIKDRSAEDGHNFFFEIVNKKKYLMAKIKYGI